MNQIGAVILAAGASTRMGQPKQLLEYQGKSLISRITGIAIEVIEEPVVVVIGAYSNLISKELKGMNAQIVKNPEWTSGIATSIRTGLLEIRSLSPQLRALFFLVCDQPFVTAGLLTEMLLAMDQSHKNIVACSYNDTLGTPVLIARQYFKELLLLRFHDGAKKIIQRHPMAVQPVPFPNGNVDIDTLQDYISLQSNN